jgi:outer membrane autotransporter protein
MTIGGTLGATNASGQLYTGNETGSSASTGGTYVFTGAAVATLASLGGTNTFTAGLTATNVSVLGTVNIGASGTTVNLSGLVNGGNSGGAPLGTLNYLGSTTISSSIGAAASLAAVNFTGTNATVNIGANINAIATTVTGSAAVALTATQTMTGSLSVGHAATLDLGAYSSTATGTFTAATGGTAEFVSGGTGATIKTTAYSSTQMGKLTVLGTASVASSTKVYVNVLPTVSIANGASFTVVSGSLGGAVASLATGNITTNSAVLSFYGRAGTAAGVFSADRTQGDVLYLVAVRNSGGFTAAASLPSGSPAAGASAALNTIASGGAATGDLLTVVNLFNSYTAAQLQTELPKLAPVSAGAVTTAAASSAGAGLNSVSSRLASLRGDTVLADSNSAGTGIAGGDKGRDQAFWIKAYGSAGKQKSEVQDGGTFNGYNVSSSGFAVGVDADVGDDLRVGGAFTYGATGVGMLDGAAGSTTNIKTNQLTVYGMKEMGDMYIDAMVAYAVHGNSATRAAAHGRTATSSYNATPWTARVGGGYRMPMGGGTVLTPLAALEWSTLKTNAYQESGAGAISLNVDGQTNNTLRSSLGLRYSGDSTWSGTAIKPEVHALWSYNFGDEKKDTTSTFTGGGASFVTTGQKIDRNSWNVGGGVAFLPNKTSKITVVYDYDTRRSYAGHAVSVTGRWNF